MSYAKINDLWAELCAGLVLDQYKDAENLKAIIKVFVDFGQSFENAADRLRAFWDLSRAEGVVLDLIGKVRGKTRNARESDASFRQRIAQDLQIHAAGTPKFVIERSKIISGDPSPVYFEEEAARPVVFVYTPNGRQMKRSDVNALTPAGVLGVPGAKLCAANGKAIIAGVKVVESLADEDGNIITDEDGNVLTAVYGIKKKILGVAKNSAIGNI